MDIYQKKERIVLSRTTRKRRRHIEVDFESSDTIRSEFFDRYVSSAFINYSKVIDSAKKTEKDCPPGIAHGLFGKAEADAVQRAYDTGIYSLYRRILRENNSGRFMFR